MIRLFAFSLRKVLLDILAVFFLLCVATSSLAHDRSEAFSNWLVLDGLVTSRFTVATADLMRLKDRRQDETLDQGLMEYLLPRVKVSAAEQICPIQNKRRLNSKPGYQQFEVTFSCQQSSGIEIQYHGFFNDLPGHTHFARLKQGEQIHEFVFSLQARNWSIDKTIAAQTILDYMWLGMGHLFSGWDHIAFLLALLLSVTGLRATTLMVTGFTLGHSLTLALALLALLKTNTAAVEALIGLSILTVALSACLPKRNAVYRGWVALGLMSLSFVAAVAIWYQSALAASALAIIGLGLFSAAYIEAGGIRSLQQSLLWPCLMTFVFGLVHGLGFAGFLSDKGYGQESLIKLLVGFNLGIELAQLAIIFMVAAALFVFRRIRYFRQARETRRLSLMFKTVLSSLLAGLGAYWFVLRLAG